MGVDVDKFETVKTHGPLAKLEREVETPLPENEDGSGYCTETSRMVIYRIGDYLVKVARISNRGWSVTRYDEGGLDERDGYYDSEEAAHNAAREMVEEVASGE